MAWRFDSNRDILGGYDQLFGDLSFSRNIFAFREKYLCSVELNETDLH